MYSIKKDSTIVEPFLNGRDDMIRTCDPLVPSEVRYQAALHPVSGVSILTYVMINIFLRQVLFIYVYKINIFSRLNGLCYYIFMVRLINKKNIFLLEWASISFMSIQKHLTYIRRYNAPNQTPCIYVLWHENQFGVFGVPDVSNTNILISNSLDGQIVASSAASLGFKICRGSAGRKGAVSSTLKLIEKLNSGEDVAIMVDGPRGPYHEVKHGAIALAKDTGCPIVPLHWYSEDITFVKIPSWDKMISPIGPCRILSLFGEPIYVKDDSYEQVADKIKESLLNLRDIAPEKYKEAKKQKLWNKKQ